MRCDLPEATPFDHGNLERAVMGFSGGVDCHFTAMRHSRKYFENNPVDLGGLSTKSEPFDFISAILVHGFDVRFENTHDFNILRKRVEKRLNHLQVELSIVRTDISNIEKENCEHSFGVKVASALHQFSNVAKFGVIASGSPHSRPLISYGSQLNLDHLYSGGR